jgi:hypothetical protein
MTVIFLQRPYCLLAIKTLSIGIHESQRTGEEPISIVSAWPGCIICNVHAHITYRRMATSGTESRAWRTLRSRSASLVALWVPPLNTLLYEIKLTVEFREENCSKATGLTSNLQQGLDTDEVRLIVEHPSTTTTNAPLLHWNFGHSARIFKAPSKPHSSNITLIPLKMPASLWPSG